MSGLDKFGPEAFAMFKVNMICTVLAFDAFSPVLLC